MSQETSQEGDVSAYLPKKRKLEDVDEVKVYDGRAEFYLRAAEVVQDEPANPGEATPAIRLVDNQWIEMFFDVTKQAELLVRRCRGPNSEGITVRERFKRHHDKVGRMWCITNLDTKMEIRLWIVDETHVLIQRAQTWMQLDNGTLTTKLIPARIWWRKDDTWIHHGSLEAVNVPSLSKLDVWKN
jgi:hypothetical protein